MSIFGVISRMRENSGKMRTRITRNKDSFYAMSMIMIFRHLYIFILFVALSICHFVTLHNIVLFTSNRLKRFRFSLGILIGVITSRVNVHFCSFIYAKTHCITVLNWILFELIWVNENLIYGIINVSVWNIMVIAQNRGYVCIHRSSSLLLLKVKTRKWTQ